MHFRYLPKILILTPFLEITYFKYSSLVIIKKILLNFYKLFSEVEKHFQIKTQNTLKLEPGKNLKRSF